MRAHGLVRRISVAGARRGPSAFAPPASARFSRGGRPGLGADSRPTRASRPLFFRTRRRGFGWGRVGPDRLRRRRGGAGRLPADAPSPLLSPTSPPAAAASGAASAAAVLASCPGGAVSGESPPALQRAKARPAAITAAAAANPIHFPRRGVGEMSSPGAATAGRCVGSLRALPVEVCAVKVRFSAAAPAEGIDCAPALGRPLRAARRSLCAARRSLDTARRLLRAARRSLRAARRSLSAARRLPRRHRQRPGTGCRLRRSSAMEKMGVSRRTPQLFRRRTWAGVGRRVSRSPACRRGRASRRGARASSCRQLRRCRRRCPRDWLRAAAVRAGESGR